MQTLVMAVVGNVVGIVWPETFCAKFIRMVCLLLAGIVTSATVTVPGRGKSVNVHVEASSGPGSVAPLGNWIDPHSLKGATAGLQSTSMAFIVSTSGPRLLRSSFN